MFVKIIGYLLFYFIPKLKIIIIFDSIQNCRFAIHKSLHNSSSSKKVIRKLSSKSTQIEDYSYYHKGTSYNSHRLKQHSSDYNLKQRPIKNRKVKKKDMTNH
ncbi:hypothetical protein BpHYR1_023744 [Brachionus plicatilis]|uniref:Uncharacterized protein n=1 Tax=Brachionus plicatilis TaxID=10195 RepID=A0A3M7RQX6_BRAPC|nr:hypothetical protein BpHYR1_023744 [Brachionus plicatilis]